MRTVRAFLPVAGAPEALVDAFVGDPARWLPAAHADDRPGDWLLRVRAGSLSRQVRARVGDPWTAGTTRWRTLAWDPEPNPDEHLRLDRFLPTFDGELGLHADDAGRVTLILDARYRPPGGTLGAAVDAVALHRVAKGSIERLLEDLGARLTSEAMHLAVATHGAGSQWHAPDDDGAAAVGS
jgi:hypothetical protein